MVDGASILLDRIGNELRSAILDAAPAASPVARSPSRGWVLRLNQATILFDPVVAVPADPWEWTPPAFRVLAHSLVAAKIPREHDYDGRAHSLWFCDAQAEGEFQWFETAFMISPLIARRSVTDPFAFAPGEEAAKALWRGIAEYQVAWPFTPIVGDDHPAFVERWIDWFACAASGQMHHPIHMPERDPQGSWRG